jgi:hypothetical protein
MSDDTFLTVHESRLRILNENEHVNNLIEMKS